MSNWIVRSMISFERAQDWLDEKLYRFQTRFNLTDLQMIYLAFLSGAALIWAF